MKENQVNNLHNVLIDELRDCELYCKVMFHFCLLVVPILIFPMNFCVTISLAFPSYKNEVPLLLVILIDIADGNKEYTVYKKYVIICLKDVIIPL